MDNLPKKMSSLIGQLTYALGIPVFFLGFVMLYRPLLMESFFTTEIAGPAFNVTMLMCIELVAMLGSRLTMWLCRDHMRLNGWTYALWCLGEVVFISFFLALYMTLMHRHAYPYFTAFGYCLGFYTLVAMWPYALISLLLTVLSPQEQPIEEDSLVRFHDNTQKLKFIIASSALLYVEADENYIKVVYREGEKVLTYSLRSSMKAIEEQMLRHGLVRCQRSYYINPTHVKALRRDKDGALYADLSIDGTKPIPVSAMYQQALSQRL